MAIIDNIIVIDVVYSKLLIYYFVFLSPLLLRVRFLNYFLEKYISHKIIVEIKRVDTSGNVRRDLQQRLLRRRKSPIKLFTHY